ncbi:MAG: transporter substrate-binding domain-containing protein [Treponema sp.]|jgi:signal transduction histidine kinase/ABC-type amino acid transport substrate-binding protein|nr:transporter substrate-binding domain-containing protein [Treponema sp.]
MLKINRKASTALAIIVITAVFSACDEKVTPVVQTPQSPFASFTDIPGITAQEIAGIEALQKQSHPLIFGTPLGTELFRGRDGNFEGYIARYCDWMTSLFGIRFTPEVFVFSEMLANLMSKELDFGIVRDREELRKDCFLTDAIGQRIIIMVRIRGSEDLSAIRLDRPPRYAFLQASSTYDMVAGVLASGTYEAIFAANAEAAYTMLKSGVVDAIIEANNIEGALEKYNDVYSENFLPLLFNPINMMTAKEELEPVISVVTKALRNGATSYLIYLYEEGYRDFMKHRIAIHLSEAEWEYIDNHPVVPIVANYDNYPANFYNTREGKWQGIFFDIMDEITAITGLSFELINKNNDDWPVIYEMAKSGEASLIASLTWTREREEHFIWPETAMQTDYFALISKLDYPDITIREIYNVKVGVPRSTVHASMFRQWFPNHPNTTEYENMDEAIFALQRDEVDLVMSSQRRLMYLTHFLELPGYKTNIVFDQPIQTISGLNKNEEVLCSIIDKALRVIDTRRISDKWMRKTYDYRAKVSEARLPWFIGASIMSLAVLALILVMFSRNRSEGKRLEKLVAKQTEEVRNASEAKSRFVANMNHEMRTPMNVIVGLTDLMMEEDDVSEKIKVMTKKINTAGSTLIGLINDVLDISKIEAGKMELMPAQYDVAGLLNEITTLNMIHIGEKPIAFKLNIESELPTILFGDDLRIKQILNNLLSNAFKYTKSGTVTLGIAVKDGVRVSFYVSDTGIGIRTEDMAKLFSDYNQVDTYTNRRIEGTGLGLSITKKFVDLMDGEITVESEYGKGTTFRVHIKQGFVTEETIDNKTLESLRTFRYSDDKKEARKKFERADLSYARVLVVDDFPTNLDVASGMLHKYKMKVDCVMSGQEAVDLIAGGKLVYNAIFMDHMMPEMDGVEAVKLIRALGTEYAKNIPIIALTANTVAGNEQMFLENGFNAYLPKPFNAMSLDVVVQKWIKSEQ